MLSLAKMEELSLFRGDTVLIKGKKKHETVCVAIMDEDTEDAKVSAKQRTGESSTGKQLASEGRWQQTVSEWFHSISLLLVGGLAVSL
jgi:hypothetical protein